MAVWEDQIPGKPTGLGGKDPRHKAEMNSRRRKKKRQRADHGEIERQPCKDTLASPFVGMCFPCGCAIVSHHRPIILGAGRGEETNWSEMSFALKSTICCCCRENVHSTSWHLNLAYLYLSQFLPIHSAGFIRFE